MGGKNIKIIIISAEKPLTIVLSLISLTLSIFLFWRRLPVNLNALYPESSTASHISETLTNPIGCSTTTLSVAKLTDTSVTPVNFISADST